MHVRSQALVIGAVLFILAVVLLWPVKRPAHRCPRPAACTSVQKDDGGDVPLAYWLIVAGGDEEEETASQPSPAEEETPDADADAGADAGGDAGGDGGGD
jgi:hypothetical protein